MGVNFQAYFDLNLPLFHDDHPTDANDLIHAAVDLHDQPDMDHGHEGPP